MSEVFHDFEDNNQFHHTLKDGNRASHNLKILAFVEMPPTPTVRAKLERNAGGARNLDQIQEKTMTVTTSEGVVWVIEIDIEAPYGELPYRLTDAEEEWVRTSVKGDLDRREQGQFCPSTVSCYTRDGAGKESIVPVGNPDFYEEPGNSFSGDGGDPTFTGPGW